MEIFAFMTFLENFKYENPDHFMLAKAVGDRLWTNSQGDQFYMFWDPIVGFLATTNPVDSMKLREIRNKMNLFEYPPSYQV